MNVVDDDDDDRSSRMWFENFLFVNSQHNSLGLLYIHMYISYLSIPEIQMNEERVVYRVVVVVFVIFTWPDLIEWWNYFILLSVAAVINVEFGGVRIERKWASKR